MEKWGAATAVRAWRMWNFCLHRVVVIYGNHTRVHSHTHADTEIIGVCFGPGSSSVIKAGHFFRQNKKSCCLSAPISKCMHAAVAWARPRVELNVFRRDTSDEVLGQTRRSSAEFKNVLGGRRTFAFVLVSPRGLRLSEEARTRTRTRRLLLFLHLVSSSCA